MPRITSRRALWLLVPLALLALLLLAVLLLSSMICLSVRDDIRTCEQVAQKYDVILVPGCGIKPDGQPSNMLEDRLKIAISLYARGAAPYILLSGDHEAEDYDEVMVMKRYCMQQGVPESAILCDRYGLSTYDTVVRAATLFAVERAVIVTQEYHLYRALYIAHKSDIEAVGVSADLRPYRKEWYRNAREVLARCKDFFTTYFDVAPQYTTLA